MVSYVLPFLVFGILMITAVLTVSHVFAGLNPLLLSVAEIAAGAVIYLLLSFFWIRAKDRELLTLLKSALPGKK